MYLVRQRWLQVSERLPQGWTAAVLRRWLPTGDAAPAEPRGARWSDDPLGECRTVVVSLYDGAAVRGVKTIP